MKKILLLSSLCFIFIIDGCKFKINKSATYSTTQNEVEQSVDKKEQNDIPFPETTSFTKEYLEANFGRFHYNLNGMEYYIFLPNDMKLTELKPSQVEGADLTTYGIFQSTDPNKLLEVYVYTEKVKDKIDAAAWLLKKLSLASDSIINKRFFEYEGEKYVDVLSMTSYKGDAIISRHMVYRYKDNYFYIRADCDSKLYNEMATTIFYILGTWSLKAVNNTKI